LRARGVPPDKNSNPGLAADIEVTTAGGAGRAEASGAAAKFAELGTPLSGVVTVPGVRQAYEKMAVVRHAPLLDSGRVEAAGPPAADGAESPLYKRRAVKVSFTIRPFTPRSQRGGAAAGLLIPEGQDGVMSG
jgi:hypothetical protein